MDRLTRHQMKQDDLQVTYEKIEDYFREHYRDMAMIAGIVIVVVGGAVGLKEYRGRQEAAANMQLATALSTFNAYVGSAAPGTLGAEGETFATQQAKYQRALHEFLAVEEKYPRTKAATIALVHAGVSEGLLGDDLSAIKTLEDASKNSNAELASLARLALAGELVKIGKLAPAEKIYLDLSAHPTLMVPRATALLSLARAESATEPGKARQIYLQLQTEYASDPMLAQLLKQQIAGLPQ